MAYLLSGYMVISEEKEQKEEFGMKDEKFCLIKPDVPIELMGRQEMLYG